LPIPSFLVVSCYKESYYWIRNYVKENYVVYNHGDPIENDSHVLNVPNTGGNQADIFRFICENYNNLPELTAFVQGYPYDHCMKEFFDKLIFNTSFTSIEFYGSTPANSFENRDESGGFMEVNNSWYIYSHNQTYNQTCRYSSFDEFMNKYFVDYKPLSYIRFCPGSQYIVPKHRILYYSKKFWENLLNEIDKDLRPTEGHIIERALWYIFNITYMERYAE
jgi:hypothetical protein